MMVLRVYNIVSNMYHTHTTYTFMRVYFVCMNTFVKCFGYQNIKICITHIRHIRL